MYLGLSFVRTGFTNYAYLTATQKANASGGSLVNTPTTGMAAGTYEVALFFAEFQKELTAPDITNKYYGVYDISDNTEQFLTAVKTVALKAETFSEAYQLIVWFKSNVPYVESVDYDFILQLTLQERG